MQLAETQVAQREACCPQRTEQLQAVVGQGLQPGPRSGSHREDIALPQEWPAVRSQLGSRDGGPGLPEGGPMAVLTPVTLQLLQAAGQG
jgi:hypothetical protein